MRSIAHVAAVGPQPTPRTALVRNDHGLAVRRIRIRDRILARLRSDSLDAELAAGLPPEHRWLRAVRATQLVALGHRSAIAVAWGRVRARAVVGSTGRVSATSPVRHGQIHAAADLIDQLIDALTLPGPISARGVAMAQSLLTDASGPVHARRAGEELAVSVAAAVRQLLWTDEVSIRR